MGKPATFTSPLQISYFTRTEENEPIDIDVVNQIVNDFPPSTPKPIDPTEIWMPEDSQQNRDHYLK